MNFPFNTQENEIDMHTMPQRKDSIQICPHQQLGQLQHDIPSTVRYTSANEGKHVKCHLSTSLSTLITIFKELCAYAPRCLCSAILSWALSFIIDVLPWFSLPKCSTLHLSKINSTCQQVQFLSSCGDLSEATSLLTTALIWLHW